MHANTLSLVAIWGIVLTTRGHVHSQPVETSVYTIREEDVVYRAAVLEYRAYDDMAEGGLAVLRENARVFVEYAEAARQQGADIIVFPEYGLTGSTSRSLADFMSKTQALPDPGTGTVLCNSTDTSESIEAVRVLSCAAAELGMYLVVNLAEQVPCEPQMNPRGHLQGSALESTRGIGEEPLGGGGGGGRGGERDSEEGDEEHKDLRGEETDPGEGGRKEPNQKVNRDPKHREGKRDLGEGDETRDPEGGDGGGAPRECLDSGFYVFNTEVVFDRAGVVVAKYHKKSLYLEPGFTPGSQDDKEAIFTTDFGVTFSLQVCFDILYGGPGTSNVVERGVTDVIMSSYWVDELPFLAAPQMWQSWSEGLAVNLMVANFHNPEEGALGSGIFRGLTSQESLYTYDPNSGTKLLVGEVVSRRTTPLPAPTGHGDDAATPEGTTGVGSDGTLIQSSSQAVPVREEVTMGIHQEASWIPTDNGDVEKKGHPEAEGREIRTDRVFLHEDLERYSNFALERGDGVMERSLCHNDSLCCSVTYSFPADPTDESSFLLLAYSGVAEKGDGAYLLFTQVCAIVYCLNENVTSCARIEENEAPQKTSFRAHNITGDFDTSYIYPSVFTQELKLVDTSLWDFESSVSSEKMVKSTLVLHEDVDYLLSLRLFGRWFDRDP
ncbi:biotinidase-like isoform X2 [Penaeus chinensis]|uniref:biotinidase-like isoform X2 n=1 Tax=Penaeus chinensis TaxID=139456 RepID=UPI001FB70892|nr:biotinidase-like isoform X2 [Penaeus chinensis]